MRKWVYLVIGSALVVNAMVAVVFSLPMPVRIFQALWGILGVVLLMKAVNRFRQGGKLGDGTVKAWLQQHWGLSQLLSLSVCVLLLLLVNWWIAAISFIIATVAFEAIKQTKPEEQEEVK